MKRVLACVILLWITVVIIPIFSSHSFASIEELENATKKTAVFFESLNDAKKCGEPYVVYYKSGQSDDDALIRLLQIQEILPHMAKIAPQELNKLNGLIVIYSTDGEIINIISPKINKLELQRLLNKFCPKEPEQPRIQPKEHSA